MLGLWHPGSGLGDQLFCFLAAKITAERLGVPFSMVGEFKGKSFIHLPEWEALAVPHHIEMPAGKIVIDNDWPIYEGKTYYDPEFNFIEDNTIVDGCRCQDERYFENYPLEDWLQTESLGIPDDLCIINFRGGEYAMISSLFLPKEYYDTAIAKMREFNPYMRFEVHSDDPALARTLFPEFNVIDNVQIAHSQHTNMGLNWRALRYAPAAILSNSAFGIIPRLLNHKELKFSDDEGVTIAPRHWSGYNRKEWAVQNYYKDFLYV